MPAASVRNPEGIWVNTQGFREDALHFAKYGYYCPDPWGSQPWMEYWLEQLRRCTEGHSSGGAYVTGDHYAYLNFCPIMRTEIEQELLGIKTGSDGKKRGLPYFWDGDFDYYHNVYIARAGITKEELDKLHLFNVPQQLQGGLHMIVGKARRKGFSYKNAAIVINRYNTIRESVSLIGAFDKKYLYPKGTMGMVSDYMDYMNEHTGFAKKREVVDRMEAKEASFKAEINGVQAKQGYKSMVLAITFKDNPGAARGKDGTLILFEEAGSFPNLETSYMVTKPTLEDGIYTTGQMIVFGTSGGEEKERDMFDFAKMFYNPSAYGAMTYNNQWDEHGDGTSCSFFFPDYRNKPGFIDAQGNSDIESAIAYEEAKRAEIRKHSTTHGAITTHTQEYCFSPEEAFLQSSGNAFPVRELRARLARVMTNSLHLKKGQPVHLVKEDGIVKAVPDLKDELYPLWEWKPKPRKNGILDLSGAVVIYEPPRKEVLPGTYIIGYDPVQQDEGTSLAAILVFKWNDFSPTRNTLVAEYYGRQSTTDGNHRIAELLSEYYGALIMHENMVLDVKTYFRNKNKLHLLALQPNNVINANIKESNVKRVYGVHMTDNMWDAGEKYTNKYLLEERDFDEDGTGILNLETIYSPGFLEEMIGYKRNRGNYDRLSAFLQILFMVQEETLAANSKNTQYNELIMEELKQLELVRQPKRSPNF